MSANNNDALHAATPNGPHDVDSEEDLVRDIAYALSIFSERSTRRTRRDPRYAAAQRVVEHLRLSRWVFDKHVAPAMKVQGH